MGKKMRDVFYYSGWGSDRKNEGQAKFHSWGCDYEELENGPGNYSVAIIELPGGSIKLVHPENIKFIND